MKRCRGCDLVYSNRFSKCVCGRKLPKTVRPKHLAALDQSYEAYIVLNGGEHCGICGRQPKGGRRLHRDHEHKGGGKPRGLLCFRCNAGLRVYMTLEWLRKAVRYMERTA